MAGYNLSARPRRAGAAGLDYSHGFYTVRDVAGAYRYYRWTTENGADYLLRRQDLSDLTTEIELARNTADHGPAPASLADFEGITWS